MTERMEQALKNHAKGYNCAQSVVCAYCDTFGVDEKTGFRLAEALGFGMGTMGTCGAVTGMALLVGMKHSDGQLDAPETKHESYSKMEEMTQAFLGVNGTVSCRELKDGGIYSTNFQPSDLVVGGMTDAPVKSCDAYILEAAEIIEAMLL